MIVTARMIIRNAQSGAAGNHTICAIAVTVRRTMATQNPVGVANPAANPTPTKAMAPIPISANTTLVREVNTRRARVTDEPPMIWAVAKTAAAMPAR